MSNIYERLFQNGLIEGLAKYGYKIAPKVIRPEIEDLNNWSWYQLNDSRNTFADRENTLNLNTRSSNYERLVWSFEAKKDNIYVFEFDLCCPTGYRFYNSSETIVCGYIADHVSPAEFTRYDMMLANTNNFNTKSSNEYEHYICSYKAAKDETLYLIINFTDVADNASYQFKIANIKLTELVESIIIRSDLDYVYEQYNDYDGLTTTDIDKIKWYSPGWYTGPRHGQYYSKEYHIFKRLVLEKIDASWLDRIYTQIWIYDEAGNIIADSGYSLPGKELVVPEGRYKIKIYFYNDSSGWLEATFKLSLY